MSWPPRATVRPRLQMMPNNADEARGRAKGSTSRFDAPPGTAIASYCTFPPTNSLCWADLSLRFETSHPDPDRRWCSSGRLPHKTFRITQASCPDTAYIIPLAEAGLPSLRYKREPGREPVKKPDQLLSFLGLGLGDRNFAEFHGRSRAVQEAVCAR